MTYIFLGIIIWIGFVIAVNVYFRKHGESDFFKTSLFRVLAAALLLLLNFLDWWLTKHIIKINSRLESNLFLRVLIEQSPFAVELHKLVIGSVVMVGLAFAFHIDALLAFIFLLASILIINGVTLLTLFL